MALRCERAQDLLPDEAALDETVAALPPWRRRKAEMLRFSDDRRRSVAVWVLLRQMLAERGLDADSLSVTENAYGKPDFAPSVGLHFSLSHAGERVMAAVADGAIGCDVEKIVPVRDGLLKAGLAVDERAALAALTGPARDRAFIRLWTRKESYVKALGRGMDVEPTSFSALDAPPTPGWAWRDFDFGDGHLGSVCFGCWR